jgi:hypothetical protein
VLGEIEIDWKSDYYAWREHLLKNTGAKEDWVRKVEGILPKVETVVHEIEVQLERYHTGHIDENGLQAEFERLESKAMELYREAGSQQIPPLDCQECDKVFQSMMAQFHNILVPFATWGLANYEWKNKMWLLQSYMRRYEETVQIFGYEWRKIRR